MGVGCPQEAALALADATQERLQLENKLMALQAKKEQMDNLLAELHALRETQLTKGSFPRVGNYLFKRLIKTLWLPRVINSKFSQHPHQKYNTIKQYGELCFS